MGALRRFQDYSAKGRLTPGDGGVTTACAVHGAAAAQLAAQSGAGDAAEQGGQCVRGGLGGAALLTLPVDAVGAREVGTRRASAGDADRRGTWFVPGAVHWSRRSRVGGITVALCGCLGRSVSGSVRSAPGRPAAPHGREGGGDVPPARPSPCGATRWATTGRDPAACCTGCGRGCSAVICRSGSARGRRSTNVIAAGRRTERGRCSCLVSRPPRIMRATSPPTDDADPSPSS